VFAIVSISGAITGLYISKMKSTNYKQLIVYPTILMVSAYLMMPFSHNLIMFVLFVIGALIGSYFRGAGITILENEMITTERATSLSFLNMIRDMSWGTIPILWGILMQAISLKTTFILAGIFSFVSFIMLMVALRIRGEKNEQDRGA
ncbi:MAG: MFS transporter, partial [Candidatus Bathyarchaeia archaeon]|nr:MFS transporter [Candidatus Bathyarchaeia archaeon]